MRVTLKDVAEVAAVSAKTVSRVVNDQGEISEATRERVLAAIQELGYRPNRLARSLTTGRTQAVGIIIPDISDPFFPELILGAESVARERDYSVFLCNANRDEKIELHYVDALADRQVDGLMIVGSQQDDEGLAATAREHNAVILTSHVVPGAALFSINAVDGMQQVGEHLLALGHRRIRFIGSEEAGSSIFRLQGLVLAMQEAEVDTEGVVGHSVEQASAEQGRKATLDLLKHEPETTAIACYNDVLALGVLQACAEVGRRVPKDISVVGFDDIPEASRSCPPLTTVRVDRQALGVVMMQKLLDVIDGKTSDGDRIFIRGELIERDSTSRPASNGV